MITFTSKTANKEELKKAIWEELIKCTMAAVGPIYGDYERTGFDYSKCKNDDDDMRRTFAISFLEEWTSTNLEIVDDGVVLNDDLHTEDTCNDGSYDLEALANAIKSKFPDVIIQGEGMIDYHYSAEEYKIYTEDGVIVYEGDGDEGFDEFDEDGEEYDDEEVEEEDNTFEYFNNIPHISCSVDVLQHFADKESGEDIKNVFDFEILPMAVDISELSMCAMWSNSEEIVSFAMNKGFSEEYSVFLVCSALFDISNPLSISGVRLTDGNVAHATRMQSLLSSLYPILLGIKGVNKMLLEENAYEQYLSTDKENCVFRLKLIDGKCSFEVIDKEALSNEINESEEEECEVAENDMFAISDDVLTRYNGQDSYVEIPYGVKQIGDGASMTFFMAPAKEIVVPDTVVTIAGYAFFRCNALEKITLSQSVSTIANHAFRECSSLKSIEFPDNVTVIDREACWGCVSLETIKLPANLKAIEEKAFSGCIKVTTIELPEGLERIEDGAFWGDAAMEKIVIPASVTSIGEMAFCDCDNLTIYTPAGSFAEKYAKANKISVVNI